MDIDSQAVEVTKLSLLLKVLEGENDQSVKGQLSLNQRALPDLGGISNAATASSARIFTTGGKWASWRTKRLYRVNAFDWQAEFPEIMAGGGFDVVMGNPPYDVWKGLEVRLKIDI